MTARAQSFAVVQETTRHNDLLRLQGALKFNANAVYRRKRTMFTPSDGWVFARPATSK
jgi:hypothetical protein